MAGKPPVLDQTTMRDDLACLLCHGEKTSVKHSAPPYRIVECDACGLVYTLPRLDPVAIEAMYQDDYWESSSAKDFGYSDYLADAELYKRTFRMRSAVVTRRKQPPARILDVGCAAGFALEVFLGKGYDVHGIELSSRMAQEATRRVGEGRIHHGTLEAGIHEPGSFDVLTMWDVIEHVEDPVALLRTARAYLKPDGILVLETQNVASLFARLLGIRWQHYKFQEHLYHFNPVTIVELLRQSGFAIEERSARRGGKYVSLGFIKERVGRLHPVLSTLASPLGLLKNTAIYVNVFDEMLVVARPDAELAHG
jgi:2-polyprenyl-3-methyl-5-hydroxy-6-metoxy-1,4-benzoquinol methylase